MTEVGNSRLSGLIPAGGIRASQCGGNTVGAMLREPSPRTDGYRHVDTPAMIRKLLALGANTYIYGIWDSPTDWDDLRLEFAPAAADAGIDVWVYLVPPSETSRDGGRASRPYVMDYVAWARACAELSVAHPNVKAWGIDDFEFNQETFTTDYVALLRKVAQDINPDLAFYLCTYFHAATDPGFLAKYGPYLDLVLYPFLDGRNLNTIVADSVGPCLDEIRAAVRPWNLDVVLLVYTGRFLDAWNEPTPDYCASAVRAGLEYARAGRIAGVTAYGLQLDDAPTISSTNKAMYGNGRLSLLVPPVRTQEGAYAQASQVVRVDPDAPRHELSFWHNDIFSGLVGGAGKHVKQVLLDGEVIWSEDVRHHGFALWQQCSTLHGPIDVTERLRGRTSATLAFRLHQARGGDEIFPVDVGFDHIETLGFTVDNPGFETTDAWTLDSSHGVPVPSIDIFVPDRPQHSFAAVAAEYHAHAGESANI
ncbi:hypothetical protein [Actinopolymorpha singaporensis]|uniref:Uncharacterized protein n=1 Tax=Actinopolymorpha singaporensis TaxID=117157 RepID=A0A1H1UST5_9ACTN|nr:hypothetical protein [Actinopolymorpha singaporensis]SDS75321.1 hypothetical protein SAMN04489717_3751 [Actinopolymorpha singaporensis]